MDYELRPCPLCQSDKIAFTMLFIKCLNCKEDITAQYLAEYDNWPDDPEGQNPPRTAE